MGRLTDSRPCSTSREEFFLPCVARWPGQLRAGSVDDAPACFTDVLPTVAAAVGCELPDDRPIDGVDLFGLRREHRHDRTLYHYHDWTLNAVRRGQWKLHLPGRVNGLRASTWSDGTVDSQPPLLYNIDDDAGESTNLADRHPRKVRELTRIGAQFDEEIQAQRNEALRRARGKS